MWFSRESPTNTDCQTKERTETNEHYQSKPAGKLKLARNKYSRFAPKISLDSYPTDLQDLKIVHNADLRPD